MEEKKDKADQPVKKKKGPLRQSPDISQLIPIVLDKNTVFYIKQGQNVDEARERFAKRYAEGMLSVEKRIHINQQLQNEITSKSREKSTEEC